MNIQTVYNGLNEGKVSKSHFIKEAARMFPSYVTKFNSCEDIVGILKSKGALQEVKTPTSEDPADYIAPDLLDKGIQFELKAKMDDIANISQSEYDKAKKKAATNLLKDPLFYKKKEYGIKKEKEASDKMEKVTLKEARHSEVHKAAKKGSYPVTIVISKKYPNGKEAEVIHQETVETPQLVPAVLSTLKKKYSTSDHKIDVEDATGKVLHKESVNENTNSNFDQLEEGLKDKLKGALTGVLGTLGIQKYGMDVLNTIMNALPPEKAQEFSDYIEGTLHLINQSPLEEGKADQLAKLKQQIAQIMSDMEQEAEMEGGPKADKYAAMLMKINKDIAKLQGTKKEKEYKLMEKNEVNEATVEMDAMNPDDKDFLNFLRDNNVKIISKEKGPNGHPVIVMQGSRKDLERVLADSELGFDDPGLADHIEEAVKVKVSIPGQDSFEAEEGKEYSEEEADEYIENAKDSGATPMNTEFEKVSEDHSVNPNDKYVVRPCKNKKEPWAVWEGEVRVKGFATKEEAQAYADKQNKEQGLNELDSKEALWPLPEEWYSKYYTVDFYADGPRFFNNETGEEVSYKDISAHYEKEAEDYSNTVNEAARPKFQFVSVHDDNISADTVEEFIKKMKSAGYKHMGEAKPMSRTSAGWNKGLPKFRLIMGPMKDGDSIRYEDQAAYDMYSLEESAESTKDKLDKLTAKMRKLAKEYTAAKGDAKDKLKDKLKDMTPKKKELEKKLEDEVAAKGKNQKLDPNADLDESKLNEEYDDAQDALYRLQEILEELDALGDEAQRLMSEFYPSLENQGSAYGAFDLGSSTNRFDTTLRTLVDAAESGEDDLDEVENTSKDKLQEAKKFIKSLIINELNK